MPAIPVDTAVRIMVGPLLDGTDGITRETGVAYNAAGMDIDLLKSSDTGTPTTTAITLTTGGTSDWVELSGGYYYIEITAAQNNVEGKLKLIGIATGIAHFESIEYDVVPLKVYNSMVAGSDNLEVDATQILGAAVSVTTAQLGVNLVNISGSAVSTSTAQLGTNMVNVAGSAVSTTTAQIGANMVEISADATAADNLEAMMDGSGYTDDKAPSTQEQVGQITSTGSALNNPSESMTLTTGSEDTNTYTSTEALDGVYHIFSDTAGTLDLYYEFDVGSDGIPVSGQWTGYMQNNNDTAALQAYDWVSAGWKQVAAVVGANGTTNVVHPFVLFPNYVGTGADVGTVRIRVSGTGLTTAAFATDQLYVTYAVVSRTVGYEGGAVWVDTVNGTAGTVDYYNGTADRPVLTFADADTIATSVGLKTYHIAAGSTFTPTATCDSFELVGDNWTLATNGQIFTSMGIHGASVSGTVGATSSGNHWVSCGFATSDLAPGTYNQCGFSGTHTVVAAGDFFLLYCYSLIAGTTAPIFDTGAAIANVNLNMRPWAGGVDLRNIGQAGVDNMSIEGTGHLTVNANCQNTDIAMRGPIGLTNNGTNMTFSDIPRVTQDTVAAAVLDAASADHLVANSIGDKLNNIPLTGAIVDGVWDEDLTAHTTASTSGKLLSDAATAASIAALNDPTAAAIADAVLDEALSGHVTAGTAGKALSDIETDATAILADTADMQPKLGTPAADIAADIAAVKVDTAATLVDTGTTIPAQITAQNDLSATEVENAVWDATQASHTTAGTTGESLDNAGGGSSPSAIADAVWDELLSGHAISGSAGEALSSAGSGASASVIADAVWDEALSGHVTAGTAGKAVADIETDSTAILADTADMQPKLGTPAADVSADIAAVKVDTAATLVDTAAIDGRLPTDPADESLQQAAHTQTQADILARASSGSYSNGSIYIDTVNGSAGTTPGLHGTDGNPVSTLADALTLSTSLGLKKFHVATDSYLQPVSALADMYFYGELWGFDPNGQDLNYSIFEGCFYFGTPLAASGCDLVRSILLSGAVPENGRCIECVFQGSLTVDGAVELIDCSTTGQSITRTLTTSTGANSLALVVRGWKGGDLEIANMGQGGTDTLFFSGEGELTLNANCIGGTVKLGSGNFKFINNGSGITLEDDIRVTDDTMADAVWDETQSEHVAADTMGGSLNGAGGGVTAAAIADAVWDEPMADHLTTGSTGAVLNGAGGGAVGANAITLHTQTTGAVTVGQVAITVKDEADTSEVTSGTSGLADGDLGISLDNGTYSVHVVKSGYTATSPQSVVVSGAATHNLTIDTTTTAAPSDPTLCRIFGRIVDASGTAVEGVVVRAKATTPTVAQGLQQHSQEVTATTDASGDFTLDLSQGAVVQVTVNYVGYSTSVFTVPATGTQDLATWTPN